jgi:hypothetical protein
MTPRLVLPLLSAALCALLAGCVQPGYDPYPSQARQLPRANVLPLAIDPAFSFRKVNHFLYDFTKAAPKTTDPMLQFERQRMAYGAIADTERHEREGYYYTFWWRAGRRANLTARFEYRQEHLGGYVQAQEVALPDASGTLKAFFKVTGDAYRQDGPIIAWRALLIENGKVVALTQSFLWH